jgi:hypothetical protein
MLELSDVDIFALGTRGDMQKMYLADKFMLELFEVHQFALCTWWRADNVFMGEKNRMTDHPFSKRMQQ